MEGREFENQTIDRLKLLLDSTGSEETFARFSEVRLCFAPSDTLVRGAGERMLVVYFCVCRLENVTRSQSVSHICTSPKHTDVSWQTS